MISASLSAFLQAQPGYKEHRSVEVRFACPQCGTRGKEPHFYFNTDKLIGHCFHCDYSPTAIQLVMFVEGIPFHEAREIVYGNASYEPKPRLVKATPVFPPVDVDLPDFFVPFISKERKDIPYQILAYLAKRQINYSTAQRYQMGYAKDTMRLIIPIIMYGRVVGWQGRDTTGNAEKKYMNPKHIEFAKLLFNYDLARSSEEVILTEGVFDAIRAGASAVATFGHKVSEYQRQLVVKHWKQVTVMFDADAVREAMQVVEEIRGLRPTRFVVLPDNKDPGDTRREELEELIRIAPFSDSSEFLDYKLKLQMQCVLA